MAVVVRTLSHTENQNTYSTSKSRTFFESEDVFAITSMACLGVKIWFGFSIGVRLAVGLGV